MDYERLVAMQHAPHCAKDWYIPADSGLAFPLSRSAAGVVPL